MIRPVFTICIIDHCLKLYRHVTIIAPGGRALHDANHRSHWQIITNVKNAIKTQAAIANAIKIVDIYDGDESRTVVKESIPICANGQVIQVPDIGGKCSLIYRNPHFNIQGTSSGKAIEKRVRTIRKGDALSFSA
ncbi:hypothetical protein DSECCO2_568710 [anaerobic digester metagenome]